MKIKKISCLFGILFLCLLTQALFSYPSFAIEARIDDGQIHISWVAPTMNEDGTPLNDLKGYYIYRAQGTGDDSFKRLNEEPVRGICYTDSGLTNGITYFYTITAVDYSGNESKRSPVVSAVPQILPPSGLKAKPGDGKAVLFWEPYEKSQLKGYFIYRRGVLEKEFKKLNTIPVQTPSFTDNAVANGIAYFYKVSCVGIDAIEGLPSKQTGVTPMALIPQELSSVNARFVKEPKKESYIELTWDKSKEEDVRGYRIYRRLLSEREFTLLTPSPLFETNFKDTSFEPDQIYLYSVVAVTNSGMESQYPRETQCFTSAAYIASFSHDSQGRAKKAGDRICFFLRGEPNGKTYVYIEGVTTADIPMEEIEEGLYSACIDVTEEMSIEQGKAAALLEDKLGNRTLIEAEDLITIDNQAPDAVKEAKADWEHGTIVITWSQPEGEFEGIEISRREEGSAKGEEYDFIRVLPRESSLFYDAGIKPDRLYFYSLCALDRAGNRSAPCRTASVYVPYQEDIPFIREIHEDVKNIPQKTGDAIEIELIGEEDCNASFFIPDIHTKPIVMSEERPGIYKGIYIVGPGDKTNQGFMKVCLNDDLGHSNCRTILSGLIINGESQDKMPPSIYAINHNAFEIAGFSGCLVPGDNLEVNLSAESGCKAYFLILPKGIVPSMKENPLQADDKKECLSYELAEKVDFQGVYTGSAQIDWRDKSIKEAYVWVCMSDWAGNKTWKSSQEGFSIDTRPRIAVTPDNSALWLDQRSQTRIKIKVKDANDDSVQGHRIALSLSTTGEYTGVVGGGDFGSRGDDSMGIDFNKTTDLWGEIEADYEAGFAAKTALVIAKDLTTGHAGVGYVLNILKAQTDILLAPPSTLARFLKPRSYKLILTAEPDHLTADGVSISWITAQLADQTGNPIEKEGIPVSFYKEGNGSLSIQHDETDSSGQAHVRYTAGIVRGTVMILAVCNSLDEFNGSSGHIRLALMSDAPAKMALIADPNSLIADGKNQSRIKVWVRDINDNPVQQAMVEFSASPGSKGSLSHLTNATDFNGWAGCIFTPDDLTGQSSTIVTITATVTSKVPQTDEILSALGTVFVPILYPEMDYDDEARLAEWLCRKGDAIKEGTPLVRLETGIGEMYIKAPVSGELIKIEMHKGDKVRLGQTLGQILANESYWGDD